MGLNWIAYVGRLPLAGPRRHPANAYYVGLEAPLHAEDAGTGFALAARTLYAPAEAASPRVVIGDQPLGALFLGPDNPAYYLLRERGLTEVCADDSPLAHAVTEVLRRLYLEAPDYRSAQRELEQVFGIDFRAPLPVEPRVARAIRIVSRRPDQVRSAARLAAHVGMSETRLVHLFSEQAGVTFRRLRLWARLAAAGRQLLVLPTLTDIAMEAGFSDLAHLSRTFRGLFGISTTTVISLKGNLVVRLRGGPD